MTTGTQAFAFLSIVVSVAGIAWALFWPGRRVHGGNAPSTHWDLIYVDDNGVLLFTLVRVLKIDPEARRLTAWCSRTGAQRVFKLSKIIKATDVNTGLRINMARLMDVARSQSQSDHASGPDTDTAATDGHGPWRRLALRTHN